MATKVKPLAEESEEKTVNYYFREFLNPEKGTAFLEIDASALYGKNPYIEAGISFADCSRKAVIDFYTPLYTDAYSENCSPEERIAKLNMLVDELIKFRDWYMEHVEALKNI